MFRPESDWSGQGRFGVKNFFIEAATSVRDAYVDVRHFDWVQPSSGVFSPERHYLDYSLDGVPRRSMVSMGRPDRRAASGDILYMPPHRQYFGEPALQQRHLVCVALGEKFLEKVFDGAQPLNRVEPCADIQNISMRRLFEGLAAELRTPGFASQTMIESMLMGLAVELVRHMGPSERAYGNARNPQQVQKIIDYVMDNLSQPLTVADIARDCNMSVRHVARVFREGSGVSLGEFVARSRIAMAKELLQKDDARIKEISWRCGFSSTSSFSAAFRSATGQTPKAFRSSSLRPH
ncbi:AraC family transcriptional regulator [Sphingobium fontiphilum]|uniref:AraC family transcriptional regulator n=1 Tax=Sphingobium fontiphilum TaxID=944425 RepID=A0A7W6GQE1_9SPHN|nr:AraC family transcriptional regulator [Sphingobium fontiphilum]MBB3981964.1 AraC family transcriptional regulator [Sphingobium fontiphilum]